MKRSPKIDAINATPNVCSTTLSVREKAVVDQITALGIDRDQLLRVALNLLLDELVNDDGRGPDADRLDEFRVREYSQLIERHGCGRGVSLHSQRLENEAMNTFVLEETAA